MNIDFISPESWQSLCDHLSELVKISKKNSLRVYNSSYSALYEVVVGTAQFMSHKRSVAAINGMSPHIPKLLPYFFKETYSVQLANLSQVISPKEWVDALKKDTLFVVFAEDHPITGEFFEFEELDQLLNEKKIYSIRISYSSFWKDIGTREERHYSVRVCALQNNLAFAVTGERFKSPNLITSEIPHLESAQVTTAWQRGKQDFFEDKEAVEKFESKLPRDFLRWPMQGPRIYDRAVIYHPDLNGEALQQGIARELGIQLAPVGFEKMLETTNLCRWRSQSIFSEGWWEHLPKDEVLRGMLILGVPLLKEPRLFSALEVAAKQSYFEL